MTIADRSSRNAHQTSPRNGMFQSRAVDAPGTLSLVLGGPYTPLISEEPDYRTVLKEPRQLWQLARGHQCERLRFRRVRGRGVTDVVGPSCGVRPDNDFH